MKRDDLLRWRRTLGINQQQAAEIAGWAHKNQYYNIESRADWSPVPRWIRYLVAWTYLYGTRKPFPQEDLGAAMLQLRKRFHLKQRDLAQILSIHLSAVGEIEREQVTQDRTGLGFAVAWITLYGTRLPFPSQAHLKHAPTRRPPL